VADVPATLRPASLTSAGGGWRPRLRTLPALASSPRRRRAIGDWRPSTWDRRDAEVWRPALVVALARTRSHVSYYWSAGTPPTVTVVVSPPNWGVGGRTLSMRRTLVHVAGAPPQTTPSPIAPIPRPVLRRGGLEKQRGVLHVGRVHRSVVAGPDGRPGPMGPTGPPGPSAHGGPRTGPIGVVRVLPLSPAPMRQGRADSQAAPADLSAVTPPARPFGDAVVPPPNLDQVTTEVIRRIERRAVAQRERLGRG
jgi:hypothetical protein